MKLKLEPSLNDNIRKELHGGLYNPVREQLPTAMVAYNELSNVIHHKIVTNVRNRLNNQLKNMEI